MVNFKYYEERVKTQNNEEIEDQVVGIAYEKCITVWKLSKCDGQPTILPVWNTFVYKFLGGYSNRYVTACIIPTTSELYVYHFWWLSTWFDSLQPFPSKVNFTFYPFDFLEFHNQNRHTHIVNRWNLRHLHKKQVMWQLTTDNYCTG